jgi:hypothetical protein
MTILIIERRIESAFAPVDLGTPILIVFTNDLIAASTTLGIVVVSRDRDYISWIDLDDHGVTTIGIREVREILDGAEVQSSRASAILVLIDKIAWHLTDRSNGVIKLARMYVLVIRTNILEGKEIPIGSHGEIANL